MRGSGKGRSKSRSNMESRGRRGKDEIEHNLGDGDEGARPMISSGGEKETKMPDRSCIQCAVIACLAVVTCALIGVLVWGEMRYRKAIDKEFSEKSVRNKYYGLFRTEEEQKLYSEQFYLHYDQKRKPVPTNETKATETCRFACTPNQPGKRRKRHADSPIMHHEGRTKRSIGSVTYHGCCMSWVNFDPPTTYPNWVGTTRTIVQFVNLKQYFAIHSCETVNGCSGCTCSQESNVVTAVVHKAGVTTPTDLDDIEVDLFLVDGCCKCVN